MAAVVAMAARELTNAEEQIIKKLRELVGQFDNFTLTIYGQGSTKRRILDLAWTPRLRLETTQPLSLAVDD